MTTKRVKESTPIQEVRQALRAKKPVPMRCQLCGCTDKNCKKCIERTGDPCYWYRPELCSACVNTVLNAVGSSAALQQEAIEALRGIMTGRTESSSNKTEAARMILEYSTGRAPRKL